MNQTTAGTLIDNKYVLNRLICQSGMSSVYEATHVALDRRVAVKIIEPGQGAVQIRFERECKALASIKHPGIPEIYGWGVLPSDAFFIAMEFVSGCTLQDLLNEHKKLEPQEVQIICIQICRALTSVHAEGLIHRDIKPSNIMVARDDARTTVKLLDFGVAHALDENGSATTTNQIIGTAGYLSPEHVTPKTLEPRSDLFSLGAVMFHCLTGELPFGANNAMASLWQMRSCKLKKIPNSVPEFLRSATYKCLAPNPQDRFASAAELADVLESQTVCLDQRPGSVRKRIAVAVCICAATFLLITAIVYHHGPDASLERRISEELAQMPAELPPEKQVEYLFKNCDAITAPLAVRQKYKVYKARKALPAYSTMRKALINELVRRSPGDGERELRSALNEKDLFPSGGNDTDKLANEILLAQCLIAQEKYGPASVELEQTYERSKRILPGSTLQATCEFYLGKAELGRKNNEAAQKHWMSAIKTYDELNEIAQVQETCDLMLAHFPELKSTIDQTVQRQEYKRSCAQLIKDAQSAPDEALLKRMKEKFLSTKQPEVPGCGEFLGELALTIAQAEYARNHIGEAQLWLKRASITAAESNHRYAFAHAVRCANLSANIGSGQSLGLEYCVDLAQRLQSAKTIGLPAPNQLAMLYGTKQGARLSNRLVPIFESMTARDDLPLPLRLAAVNLLAISYCSQNRPLDARERNVKNLIDKWREVLKGHPGIEASLWDCLAKLAEQQGNYEADIEYSRNAVRLCEQRQDQLPEIVEARQLVNAYYLAGRKPAAIELLKDTYTMLNKLIEESPDQRKYELIGVSDSYVETLGIMLIEVGSSEEAAENYRNHIQLREKLKLGLPALNSPVTRLKKRLEQRAK